MTNVQTKMTSGIKRKIYKKLKPTFAFYAFFCGEILLLLLHTDY